MAHFPVLPDRRRFLAAASLTLGALALRGFPVQAAAAAHFTHGVASGDPLADRVILWTRVLPGDGRATELEVRWEIAADEQFAQLVSSGVSSTSSVQDYTVKVDAAGLQPGTAYFYRFSAQGVYSAVGRTRTLAGFGAGQLRFAVVSCSNYPQGFFHVYKELAGAELDAVLHLGDYLYEYADGGYANPVMLEQGRHVDPLHEIVSLEDYRTRYGLYRSDLDLQAVPVPGRIAVAAHQFNAFVGMVQRHIVATPAQMFTHPLRQCRAAGAVVAVAHHKVGMRQAGKIGRVAGGDSRHGVAVQVNAKTMRCMSLLNGLRYGRVIRLPAIGNARLHLGHRQLALIKRDAIICHAPNEALTQTHLGQQFRITRQLARPGAVEQVDIKLGEVAVGIQIAARKESLDPGRTQGRCKVIQLVNMRVFGAAQSRQGTDMPKIGRIVGAAVG